MVNEHPIEMTPREMLSEALDYLIILDSRCGSEFPEIKRLREYIVRYLCEQNKAVRS